MGKKSYEERHKACLSRDSELRKKSRAKLLEMVDDYYQIYDPKGADKDTIIADILKAEGFF
jgi:hypothetical protein